MALFVSLVFLFVLFFAIYTYAELKSAIMLILFNATNICFAIYYFYGYFKQRRKIRIQEKKNTEDSSLC